MRIVHLPYTYFPDPSGGTEVYVHTLAKTLQQRGVDNLIAAPGQQEQAYEYDGLPVQRLAVPEAPHDLRVIYGAGESEVARQFDTLLDRVKPDIVHLHAFTAAVSLQLVRAAKQHGAAVIYTYHTPTGSCARGTLLHWGQEVCDGHLDVRRCSACALQARGLARLSCIALGTIPPSIGQLVGKSGRQGRLWTALRMSELMTLRHAATRELWRSVDRIIALCEWAKDLLVDNGVAVEKITLSRHGLALPPTEIPESRTDTGAHQPVRLVFLGRLDRTKGIDLLVRALQILPDAAVVLDVYGITQGGSDQAWLTSLLAQISANSRIRLYEPLLPTEVVTRLRDYDALVVPSRWLETGPLVVLEAFAAGLPVVGSDLGGIAELVRHDVDGWLVPVDSAESWANVIRMLAVQPKLLAQWRTAVKPPRSVGDVANDMLTVYQEMLMARR
jgi:glycosyltransferase involved in cell wall biosynthesis